MYIPVASVVLAVGQDIASAVVTVHCSTIFFGVWVMSVVHCKVPFYFKTQNRRAKFRTPRSDPIGPRSFLIEPNDKESSSFLRYLLAPSAELLGGLRLRGPAAAYDDRTAHDVHSV